MPLRILRSRNITGANVIQVLSVAGMFGTFFLGSLYLREVNGYDPLRIGLAFLPVTVGMAVLSVRYTDRIAAKIGARPTMIAGLALITASLVLFAQAPVHGGYLEYVFPVTLLLGIGAGLAFPTLMTTAMSGVAQTDAGLASGLINTTAQVGGALGLAILATVSAGRTSALSAHGASTLAALTGGYHLAFWIAAGLAAASIPVAAVLRPASQGSAG
jgi:predicted MFS family arabinose efflux permease